MTHLDVKEIERVRDVERGKTLVSSGGASGGAESDENYASLQDDFKEKVLRPILARFAEASR